MTYIFSPRFGATALGTGALCLMGSVALADQVFLDDVIIDGSLCVGFDCVNGESFGFDTIRMKENNIRLKADDTSTSASFPNRDWQLTFNDTSNGGQNKFSVDDVTGGRTPFTIEAGARTNALYVDDGGRIGIGTSTPVTDLHAKTGNTPTLRLEQDGTSGFTPQTFDVAANEANFFVRDATNGSTLPFRLEPGAPSNAIYIEDTGDVGMGTTSPSASLHITDTAGSGPLQMVKLENNGAVQWLMENSSNGAQWMLSSGATLLIVPSDNAADAVFDLSNTGNLTIDGALTQSSDKHAKMAIEPVDPGAILQKVAGLPVSSWTYKHDADTGIRHIGPMAQDFYAAFGTGRDERGISSLDGTGVALAAIQALSRENADLRARFDALETRVIAK